MTKKNRTEQTRKQNFHDRLDNLNNLRKEDKFIQQNTM